MGEPADPIPFPTRAATPPPNQKTVDANRTEIIVLAIGILFLVSQLILIIWLFVPRAFARRPSEQRNIGWKPVIPDSTTQDIIPGDENDDRPNRRRNYRRSSTWNGRSVATSNDGHPVHRRKSSGLKPADLHTFSSSDPDSDSSDHDSSVRKGLQDTGLAATSLAIPIIPLSPRRLRSPLTSPEPEPDSNGSNGVVREIGSSPATFSPRSPRVGPMSMATMSAIFKANERKPGTTPVSSLVMDETDLVGGFDDPLGVSRRKTLFGNDNSVWIDQRSRRQDAPW